MCKLTGNKLCLRSLPLLPLLKFNFVPCFPPTLEGGFFGFVLIGWLVGFIFFKKITLSLLTVLQWMLTFWGKIPHSVNLESCLILPWDIINSPSLCDSDFLFYFIHSRDMMIHMQNRVMKATKAIIARAKGKSGSTGAISCIWEGVGGTEEILVAYTWGATWLTVWGYLLCFWHL